MKLIPELIEFPTKGFKLEQVKLSENRKVAIYKQIFFEFPEVEIYEVILVQSHNGGERFGREVEAAEYYPNENSWGINGFTVRSLEAAEAKYQELLEEVLVKESRKLKI